MRNRRGIQALKRQQKRLVEAIREDDPKLAAKLATVKLDWYQIRNSDDEEEVTDLYIYDEIMSGWLAEYFGGVSAQGLIDQLNEITASTINVRINSPGGEVFEAIAIYNALVSHSATINVFVDSLAASAASLITMAGDKITMMMGSQLMIHDAMGLEMGNAAEMREYADFLDRQSDNIASIYAERSGSDQTEMRNLMLAETWMFPDEAVELGLADEVYKRPSSKEGEEGEEKEGTESEEEDEESTEETEESTEDDEETEEEEAPETMMSRKHSIAARGFKYAGRGRAPSPLTNSISDSELDRFISRLAER